MARRHFSTLTEDELYELEQAAFDGLIKCAKKLNLSGLSGLHSHNVYDAVSDALEQEWKRSRKVHGIQT